jgi:cytochrome bd-type quinol oxidase subunit 2
MGIDLPLLWALIIGFGLMMYVVMDGFDLGIGIPPAKRRLFGRSISGA